MKARLQGASQFAANKRAGAGDVSNKRASDLLAKASSQRDSRTLVVYRGACSLDGPQARARHLGDGWRRRFFLVGWWNPELGNKSKVDWIVVEVRLVARLSASPDCVWCFSRTLGYPLLRGFLSLDPAPSRDCKGVSRVADSFEASLEGVFRSRYWNWQMGRRRKGQCSAGRFGGDDSEK